MPSILALREKTGTMAGLFHSKFGVDLMRITTLGTTISILFKKKKMMSEKYKSQHDEQEQASERKPR